MTNIIKNIPDGWELKKLRDILKLNYGKGLPVGNRSEGEYPVYGSNGIVGTHNQPLVETEGVIVGRKGSAGMVHYSKVPFYPIDTTFYITQEDTLLHLPFLFYLLKQCKLNKIKGDVGVPGLNREMAYLEQVMCPSLPEQQNIAHILSQIQSAIETQEKIIQTTTELKKALMQKLFTEGLNGEPQKETEIGLVPKSWDTIMVDKLGEIVTGTTPPTKNRKYYENGGFQFISPADLGETKYVHKTDKEISSEGLKVSRVLPKDSVLVVCIGSTIGKAGLTFEDKSATNQQINAIICKEEFNPHFIYYLLDYKSDYIRSLATPSPVPIISKGKFQQAVIPITKNRKDQLEIAKILSALDEKTEKTRHRKEILQVLFKSMLHHLMTGQIRVKDVRFS